MTTEPETPSPVSTEDKVASQATESPTAIAPSFGWNSYAERINGRFAMVGFVALLALEFITHQTFFAWLGF